MSMVQQESHSVPNEFLQETGDGVQDSISDTPVNCKFNAAVAELAALFNRKAAMEELRAPHPALSSCTLDLALSLPRALPSASAFGIMRPQPTRLIAVSQKVHLLS